jgi:hypothetical protein
MTNAATINGTTYAIDLVSVGVNGPVYCLTKIGKRGPTQQTRAGCCVDGVWHLGAWS